jgi:hypothetical protein
MPRHVARLFMVGNTSVGRLMPCALQLWLVCCGVAAELRADWTLQLTGLPCAVPLSDCCQNGGACCNPTHCAVLQSCFCCAALCVHLADTGFLVPSAVLPCADPLWEC